jgi:hypothetical protein
MSADGAIGGYFPLEVASGPGGLPEGLLGFQSARAAFLALLRHVKPRAGVAAAVSLPGDAAGRAGGWL